MMQLMYITIQCDVIQYALKYLTSYIYGKKYDIIRNELLSWLYTKVIYTNK